MAQAIAIILSLITIVLLTVFIIRFKTLFSTDSIIEKTRLYMDKMIKDINSQANRDLDLVKESSTRLKALLNESERKMELFREATNRLRDMIGEAEKLNKFSEASYAENKNLLGINPVGKPSSKHVYQKEKAIDPDAAFEVSRPRQNSLFDSFDESEKLPPSKKTVLNDETTVTPDGAAYKKVPLIITDVYDDSPSPKKQETYSPPKPKVPSESSLQTAAFSSKVWNLFNSGYPVEQIAAELSCSVTEVQLIIDMGL